MENCYLRVPPSKTLVFFKLNFKRDIVYFFILFKMSDNFFFHCLHCIYTFYIFYACWTKTVNTCKLNCFFLFKPYSKLLNKKITNTHKRNSLTRLLIYWSNTRTFFGKRTRHRFFSKVSQGSRLYSLFQWKDFYSIYLFLCVYWVGTLGCSWTPHNMSTASCPSVNWNICFQSRLNIAMGLN